MTLFSSNEPTQFPNRAVASTWQYGSAPIFFDAATAAVETKRQNFIWPEEYAHSDYLEHSLFITDMMSDPMIAQVNKADGVTAADFRKLLKLASAGLNALNVCQ